MWGTFLFVRLSLNVGNSTVCSASVNVGNSPVCSASVNMGNSPVCSASVNVGNSPVCQYIIECPFLILSLKHQHN